jgi:surface antigen
MKCNARTRSNTLCKRFPVAAKTRCVLHGGKSLSGEKHWNYKHGNCTKVAREKVKEVNAELRYLEALMIQLGMIDKH